MPLTNEDVAAIETVAHYTHDEDQCYLMLYGEGVFDTIPIEADYTVGPVYPEYAAGSTELRAASLRVYGVTKDGNSVLANIHGFLPYFFVRAPPGFKAEHVEQFRTTLNGRVRGNTTAPPFATRYSI